MGAFPEVAFMAFGVWRAAALVLMSSLALAAGGPLGIDHRLTYDDRGIWRRNHQIVLEDGVVIFELVGILSTPADSRLGQTFRKDLDSSVLTALSVQMLKDTFQRTRPSRSDNPDLWFQGSKAQSFPSGEVALQASFVTPFLAEYQADHPWVWALEALPAYDAVARMKTWGHWQTDVLAGWAIGTAFGLYSHHRQSPLLFGLLPHGGSVAYRRQW
jgi:undecaprenyl-diphosphatase